MKMPQNPLTHWGRVTHICVSKLSIFASDNGLSPGRRQAIIWTNAGILLIGPLGTNFSEIHFHSRKSIWKCHLENGGHLSRPQCVKPSVYIGSGNRWCGCYFKWVISKLIWRIHIVNISCEIATKLNSTKTHWWLVIISSGNGLLQSGSNPLPEPMLTQIFVPYGITRRLWVKVHGV